MRVLIVNLGIDMPKGVTSEQMEEKLLRAMVKAGIDTTIEVVDEQEVGEDAEQEA